MKQRKDSESLQKQGRKRERDNHKARRSSVRTEARKRAQKKHAEMLKRVEITFTPSDIYLYDKLKTRCEETGESVNTAVKRLIEEM